MIPVQYIKGVEETLTVADVAAIFHKSEKTIGDWARRGKLTRLQTGVKGILFCASDLNSDMAEMRRERGEEERAAIKTLKKANQ